MHRNLSPAGVLIFVMRFNFALLPSTWFRLSGGSRILFVRLARRALLLFHTRIFVHVVYYGLRSLRASRSKFLFSVIYVANVNLANVWQFLFFMTIEEWAIDILTIDKILFFSVFHYYHRKQKSILERKTNHWRLTEFFERIFQHFFCDCKLSSWITSVRFMKIKFLSCTVNLIKFD